MAKRKCTGLIIDLTRVKDPWELEGELISSFLKEIKKFDTKLMNRPSIDEINRKLKSHPNYEVIHVAGHGDRDEMGYWIETNRGGTLCPEDFSNLSCDVLIATSCKAYGFFKKVAKENDVKAFIAPKDIIDNVNAIIFSIIFYEKLYPLPKGRSYVKFKEIKRAFKNACDAYHTIYERYDFRIWIYK